MEYATSIVRPLIEKIDTIDLTRKSRELKVAEDYAVRLMKANYSPEDAKNIASNLVERYSSHEFVIDRTEESNEGLTSGKPLNLALHIRVPDQTVERLFDSIAPALERLTVIGRIEEANP